jgi:hypothetical protein
MALAICRAVHWPQRAARYYRCRRQPLLNPRPATSLLLTLAIACLHLGDLDTANSVALQPRAC